MKTVHRGGALRGAATLTLLMVFAAPALREAAAEPRLRVDYRPPVLTVEAEEVGLPAVLNAIGQRVGFEVIEAGGARPPVTLSLSGSVEAVLRQLLTGTSHALVYRDGADGSGPQGGGLEAVVMLGPGSGGAGGEGRPPNPPGEGAAAAFGAAAGGGPDGAAASVVAAGASVPPGDSEVKDAKTDRPATVTSETPAELEADPEPLPATPYDLPVPTVARLLRTQAATVLRPPAASESSLGPPRSEPLSSDAVATMMLQAQQSVEALVEALNAASRALIESGATER